MLEVAPLQIYGYGKPIKNRKGEVVGETLDVKGSLRLPNNVIRALGVELRKGKYRKPILIETREQNGDVFVILKVSHELEHDEIIVGRMENESG
ncbi:MAG: hypothetical protein QXF56_00925 [Candidatus Micrarchaeia archaeon]